VSGSTRGDIVFGEDGNDNLSGLSGNDLLKGGLGTDTLNGGLGTDTADWSDATGAIVFTLGATGNGVTANVAGIGQDTLSEIENLTAGSADDTLTGNGVVNILLVSVRILFESVESLGGRALLNRAAGLWFRGWRRFVSRGSPCGLRRTAPATTATSCAIPAI
jgi:Ca2+-binding RTX toxin-like protein